MSGRRGSLAVPADLRLDRVVEAHGFHELAPFHWQPETGTLRVVLPCERGGALPVLIRDPRPGTGRLELRVREALDRGQRRRLRRHLAAEVPLATLHAPLHADDEFAWIARAGWGRFLRGGDLYEDLVRVLLTTNCSWGFTRMACARLVAAYGPRGPEGARAFPPARALARRRAATLRRRLGVGYRAEALLELARAAERGEIALLEELEDPEERLARIGELRGFGPYAQAAMGLLEGAAHRVVVDSWMLARARARLDAEIDGRGLRRRFERSGPAAGISAWFTLARGEEGEGPAW